MILFHLFCLLINSFIHRRDLFSLHPSILAFRTASLFLSPTATPQANQCRMARRPSLLVIILLMYLFIHPTIFTREQWVVFRKPPQPWIFPSKHRRGVDRRWTDWPGTGEAELL